MKLTQIKRRLTISAPTFNSGASTWTLTTSAAHYLSTGDTIKFTDPVSGSSYSVAAVAGTTGSTVVFSSTESKIQFPPSIEFENFGTVTGVESSVFTFSFSDTQNGLIHVVSLGTATLAAAGVQLQGSLDGIHWINHGTAVATISAGGIGEIVISKPYVYGKLVFTGAIATAGGGNNTNTIKAYRAGC
jgi:hypothetical protein